MTMADTVESETFIEGNHAYKIYRELIFLDTPLRRARIIRMDTQLRKVESIRQPGKFIIIEAKPISAPNSLALARAIADHPDFVVNFTMAEIPSYAIVGIVQAFNLTPDGITAYVAFGFDSKE